MLEFNFLLLCLARLLSIQTPLLMFIRQLWSHQAARVPFTKWYLTINSCCSLDHVGLYTINWLHLTPFPNWSQLWEIMWIWLCPQWDQDESQGENIQDWGPLDKEPILSLQLPPPHFPHNLLDSESISDI